MHTAPEILAAIAISASAQLASLQISYLRLHSVANMPSDAPPSYESIVARLEQRLGSNPKPQDVLDAAEQLPQYEIDILVANAVQLEDLTPAQTAALHAGMVETMSSPDAAPSLKTAATNAAIACNAVETMFSNLLRSLASIDAKNTPPKEGAFVPRFEILNQVCHLPSFSERGGYRLTPSALSL